MSFAFVDAEKARIPVTRMGQPVSFRVKCNTVAG